MVLPRFIEQAFAGADLTVYGSGGQSRCFSDVTVFVQTLLDLIDRHRFARSAPLILNLGCSIPTTILELARAVLRAVPGPSTIRHIPYGEVFPGRSDVHLRVPCTRSLEGLVGNVCWPDIDTIVGNIVNPREAVPPSPRVLAAGQM
jgi:UDP-glucose 4-epimerase